MRAGSWVRRTHRISALVLALFLSMHLTNHLAGLWGVAAHQAFMDAVRLVYRSTIAEPLLLAAVLVQVTTGIAQIRSIWGQRRGAWARTQVISGLYLAFFLANHTFWVLVARIGYGLDSNFYLAATFLTIWPFPLLFAPYYILGVMALFAHIACAINFRVRSPIGERIALASIGAGAMVATAIMAVFMGALYDIQLPSAYRALIEPLL
jgi:hypothetical protein